MTLKRSHRFAFTFWKRIALLLGLLGFASTAHAMFNFTINEFNARSLSITIAAGSTVIGDQFGTPPATNTDQIYVAAVDSNNNFLNYVVVSSFSADDPNFNIGDNLVNSTGFGGQYPWLEVGAISVGDAVGPASSGTTDYTLHFYSTDTDIFDLSSIDRLVLIWGSGPAFNIDGGMWQGFQQVVVPEPATYGAVFAAGALLIALLRRRFRPSRGL